jgi:hypothetical protein
MPLDCGVWKQKENQNLKLTQGPPLVSMSVTEYPGKSDVIIDESG